MGRALPVGLGTLLLTLACGGSGVMASPGSGRPGPAPVAPPIPVAEAARCAPYVDLPPTPAWTPIQVVRGNLAAVQMEDLDCAMMSFHPSSSQLAPTRVLSVDIFAAYDLVYTLESAAERIHGDTAWVDYVQVTRSARPTPLFRPNRIAGAHELRRVDGRWRFWTTTIGTIDYLPE